MGVPILECKGLTKHFEGVRAIEGIDISVFPGQVCALIGPNAAGKTTVLNVIGGLIVPDRGQVVYRGRDITALPMWKIARSGVAMVFQDPRVFESLSVLDNVMLAVPSRTDEHVLSGVIHFSRLRGEKAQRASRANEVLEWVGLAEKAGSGAGELSFGQQRLLGIARALATQGDVFLLDEPSTGFAPPALRQVVRIIKRLASMDKAVLIVEHNMGLVEAVADQAYYLADGRQLSSGRPSEVLADPQVRRTYLGL